MEESKKFTTKYDDIEKSTITKVDAKTNKTVEITSIIDAKIDPTIKSSTKVLENQDYSHLDFGEPINNSLIASPKLPLPIALGMNTFQLSNFESLINLLAFLI